MNCSIYYFTTIGNPLIFFHIFAFSDDIITGMIRAVKRHISRLSGRLLEFCHRISPFRDWCSRQYFHGASFFQMFTCTGTSRNLTCHG